MIADPQIAVISVYILLRAQRFKGCIFTVDLSDTHIMPGALCIIRKSPVSLAVFHAGPIITREIC